MNSKKLPLSGAEGGWTIGAIGWSRTFVMIASVLNVLALLIIILSVGILTPFTLLASVAISGALMLISILLYTIVVIADLRRRNVL